MIGKGGSIGHTGNAIDYAKQKSESQEISRNLVSGDNQADIFNEFKTFQDLNTRCEKNTFAFVVSPSPKDELTNKQFKEITDRFLQKMNLTQHQHIAYKHIDNGKPHIHLYVNRIDMQGIAANDNFISKKAGHMADQVAQEMKLTQAKEVMKQNIALSQKANKQAFEAHKSVLKQNPKDLHQYADKMTKKGFKPVFKYSNAGKAVGVNFNVAGALVKGSAINPLMAAGKIVKSLGNVLNISQTASQTISKGNQISM